jgi:hypothetical protein
MVHSATIAAIVVPFSETELYTYPSPLVRRERTKGMVARNDLLPPWEGD